MSDRRRGGRAALAELLGHPEGPAERRKLCGQAADRPALLAAFLEELVFLAESEGFVATQLASLRIDCGRLEATDAGALGEHPPLIEAVTYHRLQFEPANAADLPAWCSMSELPARQVDELEWEVPLGAVPG